MKTNAYIYSDSLDEMVAKAFVYKGKRYEWNDADCVYYREDTDEVSFMEIPTGAEVVM